MAENFVYVGEKAYTTMVLVTPIRTLVPDLSLLPREDDRAAETNVGTVANLAAVPITPVAHLSIVPAVQQADAGGELSPAEPDTYAGNGSSSQSVRVVPVAHLSIVPAVQSIDVREDSMQIGKVDTMLTHLTQPVAHLGIQPVLQNTEVDRPEVERTGKFNLLYPIQVVRRLSIRVLNVVWLTKANLQVFVMEVLRDYVPREKPLEHIWKRLRRKYQS